MCNRYYVLYAAIISAMIFLTVSLATAAVEVPRMSTDELKSRLGDEGLIVLDVRATGDWAGSDDKIVGAERVDQRALAQWVDSQPKGQTIILYCS